MKKRFSIFICVLTISLMGCTQQRNSKQTDGQSGIEIDTNNNYDSTEITSISAESSDKNPDSEKVCWDGLTEDGMDEEVFLEDLNLEILKKVAGNLQLAVDEEIQDEKDNPEIVLTEGWIRIFDKQQYKDVVSIGKPAMKPLYWILYKSDNNGIYEYLCASALQEISGITFEDNQSGVQVWSTAKEYLDLFTEEILSEEQVNNTSLESEEAGSGNIALNNPLLN